MLLELKHNDSSSKCLVSKDSGTDFMEFHVAGDSIYISKARFCLLCDVRHWRFGKWAQGEMQLNSVHQGEAGFIAHPVGCCVW